MSPAHVQGNRNETMSEPGQLSSQRYDDVAAFRQRIAREIARARIARAGALGAFGRKALPAVMARGLTLIGMRLAR
jgi:hypothetical protein